MKFKENIIFIVIILILLGIDLLLVYKFINTPNNDGEDVIAVVGLNLAVFTLIINTYLSVTSIERSGQMEKERMKQDFNIHSEELTNQLKIAKAGNSANVLTKYRMDWLTNLKHKTTLFEEVFLKIIYSDSYSYRDMKSTLEDAQIALTNFTSSLKSELNITKQIDRDIIVGYEEINEMLSNVNALRNKTEQSYFIKCTKAYNLGLIEKQQYETILQYKSELNKYELTDEEEHLLPSEEVDSLKQQYYMVIQNYETLIPRFYEIENNIFSYFHKKIVIGYSKYSIMLRIYFKTEWERIKIEIINDDEQLSKFDFDRVFDQFMSENLLYKVND